MTNEAKIHEEPKPKRKRGRRKGQKYPKPIRRRYTKNQTPDTLTRLAADATLGSVARGTGLDMTYLSRVFGERRSASIQTMQKIAAYLGVTIDALLTELSRKD
jgi:transcriptional regulator with XRE-family HTH domain